MKEENIIVALDVIDPVVVTDQLDKVDFISWVKVGSVLFTDLGKTAVQALVSQGYKVMLDLKYHDIPNTVEQACYNAAQLGVSMITIHLSGGEAMIKAALKGAREGTKMDRETPKIIGISVLTSMDEDDMHSVGISENLAVEHQVRNLISLGVRAGVDGIVCSAVETKFLRELWKDLIIINPGIRLPSNDVGDQKRVVGPKEAFDNGASYIVVGRPIIQADDIVAATEKFKEEINK